MKIIISLLILVLIVLSGCTPQTNRKCEEIARIDYDFKYPECYSRWDMRAGLSDGDCECKDYVCLEYSCTDGIYKSFDIKEVSQ